MSLNLHPRKIWLCRAGQADGVEDFNNIKIQSPKQSKRDSKGNTIKRVTIKDRSDCIFFFFFFSFFFLITYYFSSLFVTIFSNS